MATSKQNHSPILKKQMFIDQETHNKILKLAKLPENQRPVAAQAGIILKEALKDVEV